VEEKRVVLVVVVMYSRIRDGILIEVMSFFRA
jgi:hypothetical protein